MTVIERINDLQSAIAAAVEEQAAITGEMGRSLGEAAAGTSSIAENVTAIAAAAGESAANATRTQDAARNLAAMSETLHDTIKEFCYETGGAASGASAAPRLLVDEHELDAQRSILGRSAERDRTRV